MADRTPDIPTPAPTPPPPASKPPKQPPSLPGLVHVGDPKQAAALAKQGYRMVDYAGGQYYDPDFGKAGSQEYHVVDPAEARALEAAGLRVLTRGRGQTFQSFSKAGPTNVGSAAGAGMNSAQQDAWAQLQQTLQSYGFSGADLTALVAWAKNEIVRGNSATQIGLDLFQTPQFQKRFPAIVAREKAGLPPISVSEYLSLETSYEQLERAAGVPVNFADYDKLIAADVSPSEYSDRINKGFLAVSQADPTVVKAFQDFYKVTPGQLAAYFLDPGKSLPLLEQQATAAQIGGAAAMAQFRNQPSNTPEGITQAQALRLAQMGVTQSQAQQGFHTLSQEQQLYQPLPGQGHVGNPLSNDALLNAQFGSDGQTALQLELQAGFEKGTTSEGTTVGQTQAGATGAGAVQR